jgi:hypothetical protein
MTYILRFMKTGTGVQEILRFCLINLRGSNVGITDGIYERCRWDGLRCLDTHTRFHEDWFSHSRVNRNVNTQQCHPISLFSVLQNKSRLKKKKIKLSLCSNNHVSCLEWMRVSGGTVPRINVCTRRRVLDSSVAPLPYSQVKAPRYPLGRRTGRPQSRLDAAKKTISLLCREWKSHSSAAQSLSRHYTTEVHRLPYLSIIYTFRFTGFLDFVRRSEF